MTASNGPRRLADALYRRLQRLRKDKEMSTALEAQTLHRWMLLREQKDNGTALGPQDIDVTVDITTAEALRDHVVQWQQYIR